jgi:hypothetical protein
MKEILDLGISKDHYYLLLVITEGDCTLKDLFEDLSLETSPDTFDDLFQALVENIAYLINRGYIEMHYGNNHLLSKEMALSLIQAPYIWITESNTEEQTYSFWPTETGLVLFDEIIKLLEMRENKNKAYLS